MVDSVVTKQELIDAQKDAQSLEDVINGPADTRVKPRIGPEMWTLATINSLVQQGQIKISDLSEAIQIALAAGAGSAGWTANLVADGNQTQKEINLYGGKKYDMPVGGYPVGAVVRLDNGDVVKSTVASNTKNPNVDMTGWVNVNDVKNIEGLTSVYASEFGIKTSNSASENYERMFQLINSQPEVEALDIIFPAGVFKFSRGFFITRPHTISGVGSGEESKTILDFEGSETVGTPNYQASIFIAHNDTSAAGAVLPIGQVGRVATGAVLENMKVLNSPAHGIIKNAPSHCIGVAAMHSVKTGILTAANVNASLTFFGGRISGIANSGSNTRCASIFNGESGIMEVGDDANVINNSNCNSAYNGWFGFYDASLLGGLNSGCESHFNELGDYAMQGGLTDNSGYPQTPAKTVFVSTYAEQDRIESYAVNGRSLILGATGAQPKEHNINVLLPTNNGLNTPISISVSQNNQAVYDRKGDDFVKMGLGEVLFGSKYSPTSNLSIQNTGLGQVRFTINGVSDALGFFLEDFSPTLKAERAWFPNGIAINNTHSQTVGTAAPVTGDWEKGNIVWNENPVSSGAVGWVCVESGSPGVWKTFGTISA